ncbi:uncharacterized protein BX664DRAFT_322295 [Halteromyces radiatus]|uniref:uncharacterized protein n=1 Tax=Halteromyces radiatus TaxID=101107 RepID=UPI00221FF788|nr:uncharacterized protein BX664DRAFT_322295 [Halteromyces radiatus]KAI8099871.1 hypothetical protein BX664DRAFT_322295 [Halteromyces radiatus]
MSLRTGSLLQQQLRHGQLRCQRTYATASKKTHPPRRTYLHQQYESLVKDNRALFVFQHNNLTVKEFTQLRQELTSANGPSKLTVLRSGIMGSVLRSTEFANLEPLVEGPTCVLTTNAADADYPDLLKSVTGILTKNKKMVLLGGKLDKALLTQTDINKIVALPGLDQLRAELLGTIESPARQLLRTLEAPANEVHSILDRRI